MTEDQGVNIKTTRHDIDLGKINCSVDECL
jgi:hypothetical protein